jgi:hypothetical protein
MMLTDTAGGCGKSEESLETGHSSTCLHNRKEFWLYLMIRHFCRIVKTKDTNLSFFWLILMPLLRMF